MTGGSKANFFSLREDCWSDSLLQLGGPIDAPDHLPMGGAWGFSWDGTACTYGSVLRHRAVL
jgi:hypothetical protein